MLCLALMLGLLPTGLVQPARAAHWADPYGEKLVEWGVMRRDVAGADLNLSRPITRAELVAMINRAFGYTRKAGSPFEDVPSSKWYADDIDIAYNAGYFQGTSTTPPLASPEASVTREQAAVFMARNLMLQETVGETLGFSDSRTLSEWSRGLIGAAVQENVLTGYSDGSFQPKKNITRGEVAAMLVRAIGNPVNHSGDVSLGNVYGNVTVNTSNVNLRDTTIVGNLYVTGGVDLGHVLLENVTVLGQIVISGAGEAISGQESVTLRNVVADKLVLDSLRSPFVTVKVQGVTDIPLTSVRTNAYLDDSSWEGYGLTRIELDGAPGSKLQLAGNVKEVVNLTPASDLQIVQGSAEKVTVDEYATASKVLVDTGARVDELNLDVATTVTGDGDIKNLNVGSAGSVVEQLPDQIVIRPGIDADIDGETIGSSDAAELSAEPRLLAGYPRMQNISPDQAEGVYSGNKPGTIYWAISAVSDGSVSEEDLISNPAYGGNIFEEQAGSIDATRGNTEYQAQVSNLEPDGSYYVTAMLVDGRGKHSPIKVAAFSTPDDTVPAFVKDPTMTKTTTDVAQTTVMANKDCLLYWALLPQGAQAPTPQEFKAGSVGGNYGFGSLSVVKNAEISITVNRQKLREKTTYDLFLWLTDHNGAKSMAAPFRLTFTTPDETPPVVTAPVQTGWYDNRADVTFSMNEAPATLCWAIVAEGNNTFIAPGDTVEETEEIMADLRTKIKVESGAGAITNGSTAVATAYADVLFTINRLNTADTGTNNYTLYYVGKDAAGNYSDRVQSISIQTLDVTPPTVTDPPQFTVYNGDKTDEPLADTGVKLVFSEQVKGGANAKETFLELYNKISGYTKDSDEWTAARNALAKALSDHIKLYNVPRAGDPVVLNPPDGYTADPNEVLDFRNAIVTYENGNLVVFLPGDGDPETTAIRLESGATYYFQLLGIYDNAFNPNGLLNPRTNQADPNGNYQMSRFTTVYAQVNLIENDDYVSIPAKETLTDSGLADRRLDLCFDVNAKSTNKVPETERWDLIMRSNTWIDAEIYRQTCDDQGRLLDLDGNVVNRDATGQVQTETWKLLGSTTFMTPSTGKEYFNRGMGSAVLGDNSANGSYGVLKNDLKQGYTYRYGVHITALKGEKEGTYTKVDPPTWSGTVQMKFAIIAGGSGAVADVSRRADAVYDPESEGNMGGNDVSIISQWNTRTGTEKELLQRRSYTDTRVPEFYTDFPKFTTTSGSVDMELRLTREGTVYYVIAPVDVVSPTVPNGNSIFNITTAANGSSTDSSAPDSAKDMAIDNMIKSVSDGALSYIPLNGYERERFKQYIAFTEYDATTPDGTDGKTASIYTVPTFDAIRTPSNAGYDRISSIKYGSKALGTAAETVTVSGLTAETDYYIYFVFQGGGDPGRVVECYRFTTPEAKPPIVEIRNSRTAADMSTPNDENSEIYYALAVLNSLPSTLNDKYFWTEGGTGTLPTDPAEPVPNYYCTVWEAMMRRDSSNKTLFDLYVDDVDKANSRNLRNEVYRWISKSGEQIMGRGPLMRYGPFDGPSKNQDFTNDMNSKNAEYVVFVTARNKGAEDSAANYGFAATRGLFYPDTALPEFTSGEEFSGYPGARLIALSPTNVYTAADPSTNLINDNWQSLPGLNTLFFDGSLTLRFSVPVYQSVHEGGTIVLKEVWAAKQATVEAAMAADPDLKAVSIETLLSATGNGSANWKVATDVKGAAQNFVLNYKGITYNSEISLFNLGYFANSNPDIDASTKHLSVVLDTTLTTKNWTNTPQDIFAPVVNPGFRATWG